MKAGNFMTKLLLVPPLALGLLFSQIEPRDRRKTPGEDSTSEVKLPNGKSQQEEILRVDYQKTLQDAAQLVQMAEELQDDLQKEDRHVLSLASLKKAEDIEKLAHRIRTRLRK
jgi:hypothetical protein